MPPQMGNPSVESLSSEFLFNLIIGDLRLFFFFPKKNFSSKNVMLNYELREDKTLK